MFRQTIPILALMLIGAPVYANQWVAVDCEGQARELASRVSADERLQLTDEELKHLGEISLAVCSGGGDGEPAITSEPAKKEKKGFFDSFGFGDDENAGEKKGNKRLDRF